MTRFATQNGFLAWFETSAKNNLNIDNSFKTLVGHILKLSKTMRIAPPDTNMNTGSLNVIGATSTKKALPYRDYSDEYQSNGNVDDEEKQRRNEGRTSTGNNGGASQSRFSNSCCT